MWFHAQNDKKHSKNQNRWFYYICNMDPSQYLSSLPSNSPKSKQVTDICVRPQKKFMAYCTFNFLATNLPHSYYIGVGQQMILTLHRGGLANDYSIPWILGDSIRNIISIDLTKKSDFFHLVRSHFWGGISIWLYLYIGGVRPNDYSTT